MHKNVSRMLYVVYAIGFFFAIHLATSTYINSTFLEEFVSPTYVGLIYAFAAVLGVISLFIAPKILSRLGLVEGSILTIFLHTISLYGLVWAPARETVIVWFIIYMVSNTVIIYMLDVFLENLSKDGKIGTTRGLYLSLTNIAWLLSPILAGQIIEASGYRGVYVWGFMAMMPVFFLVLLLQNKFKDPTYHVLNIRKTFKKLYIRHDLARVWFMHFILQFFYAWMVIFTPIYLHTGLGFSWTDIGIIFTIMLLPFVLIEYPLGRLSDKIGEKKMLIIGFVITAISTYILSFFGLSSVFYFALILFMTRVGASIIEIMTESYFFKSIDGADTDLIGFFRSATPLSYIIAPLLGSMLLLFISFNYLYIILSFIMVIGFAISFRLHDKK